MLRDYDDVFTTNARSMKNLLLRVLSAVGVGQVCGDVQRAWEPFMEQVRSMTEEGDWNKLELPDRLTRSMFGRYNGMVFSFLTFCFSSYLFYLIFRMSIVYGFARCRESETFYQRNLRYPKSAYKDLLCV